MRNENARRAALASGALRSLAVAGEAEVADPKWQRWEEIRVRFAERLKLPWGMDSARVLAAVAAHRAYWRPEAVRLLVLSESHVFTREAELEAQVPLAVFGHAAAPEPFVRLVYCLGYGERDLVQGPVRGNAGTAQFWKLLAAGIDPALCAQVVERTEPDLLRRLAAKLAVLEALEGARGVAARCLSGGAVRRESAEAARGRAGAGDGMAWTAYTREAIVEAAPRAVMIVGKMVYAGIGGRIRAMLGPAVPVQWMYQPQARRPAEEHGAGLARLRAMVEAAGE